jgi:hypothetical protein
MSYTRRKLPHKGQFFRLQEMLLALLQLDFSLIHVFHQAVNPVPHRLDLIP